MPLLQISQLKLVFSGQDEPVLKGIDLALAAGEKLALVGESGSGKSVLARAILQLDTGVQISGQIEFAGRNLLQASAREMRGLRGSRIAMIFQEPMTALNPLHAVGRQIAESLALHRGLGGKAARAECIRLLAEVGIDAPEEKLAALPHQLSGGQRQRVMIAMALAGEPEILIADEPTTALDVTIQAQILQLLARLQQERSMAVLMITHDLNLVRRFADRVAVMQQGELVEMAGTEALFANPQHAYTRQLLDSRPSRVAAEVASDATPTLAVTGLAHAYPARAGWWRKRLKPLLQPLDFGLRRGETLAVVGESGSGKTTLALALMRLAASGQSSGHVALGALRFDQLSGQDLRAARRHLQIVFQDPFSALSPRLQVGEIIGEGLLVHRPELNATERRKYIEDVLADVGLSSMIIDRYPHEFSGGQRQRIAIARALVLRPQVLVLDEPTSMLDASVQQQVLALLARLQREHGLSYILISHDLAVVRALAHQIIVLQQGEVCEAGALETVLAAPAHPYTRQLLAAGIAV